MGFPLGWNTHVHPTSVCQSSHISFYILPCNCFFRKWKRTCHNDLHKDFWLASASFCMFNMPDGGDSFVRLSLWALWGKSKSLSDCRCFSIISSQWMRYIPRERFLILLGDTYIYIYIYWTDMLYESAAFIIWNLFFCSHNKDFRFFIRPLCFFSIPQHPLFTVKKSEKNKAWNN